ncbi:MAG: hypothetical protein KAX40_04530 [Herpetosiphon sp.]|nr:hypothetical protein [Herpetosiphon sp.]
MAGTFKALSPMQIIDINRREIEISDGIFIPPDNLRMQGIIEQVHEEVQTVYFGEERFPSAIEQATVLVGDLSVDTFFTMATSAQEFAYAY